MFENSASTRAPVLRGAHYTILLMNQNQTSELRPKSSRSLHLVLACIAVLLLSSVRRTWASALPVGLTAIRSGDRFGLQWNAVPDAIYKVQSSSNINAGAIWTVEEPVSTNQTGPIRWMAP